MLKGFLRNQRVPRSIAIFIRRTGGDKSIAEAVVIANSNNELAKENHKYAIKFIADNRIGIGLTNRLMDCNAPVEVAVCSMSLVY